jgi:hypothetical protein
MRSTISRHQRAAVTNLALIRDAIEVDTAKRIVAWLRGEPMIEDGVPDERGALPIETRRAVADLISTGWALQAPGNKRETDRG